MGIPECTKAASVGLKIFWPPEKCIISPFFVDCDPQSKLFLGKMMIHTTPPVSLTVENIYLCISELGLIAMVQFYA